MATVGNFSVRVPVSTGSVKTIKCTGEDCPFFVTLHRRAVTTPWFVHAMVLEHVNCTSTRKPTARQLAAMTTVQSTIRANPKIRIKAITTEVQGNDGINLQAKATQYKLYRARQLLYVGVDGDGKTVTLAIALVEGETSDDYTWFFSHIQAAGLLWDVPVFADRSSGLLSSVESTWLHF
ncbi:hypothetical protein SPRG_21174 [Saprolegnia parasitica CBS 223.65]|uniref:MULE transposase domain-containing protein n=1 Tax=Saprolegnia parasitica (strain CBS 223.65) TaxID=695850 RepID=A0A067BZD2_SAPPC|nr:hypothetical protein SPRG_21174 [Saprolegnia parasitica CBS 223.65]KDO22170.1 hypothetical protein SPRG_21174 [Saprolegnia parasitica CBS 223.65]|eukprot:XP_012207137.1 hypothetical protein SPRG_21174 [Saprolegnia parasitica CBS 223.65]